VAISLARLETAERLHQAATEMHGVFPNFTIRVNSDLDVWTASGPALEAEDRMRQALSEARIRDAEVGGAAVGPHRSNIVVYKAETNQAADSCSTGEQKILLVALILAATRLHYINRGTPPILLFDDIAAHLDRYRREALFGAVADLNAQPWYTGTDVSVFEPLRGTAEYHSIGSTD
jgi:DNA replication and repair protein RecF